jgi:hypothetical protein
VLSKREHDVSKNRPLHQWFIIESTTTAETVLPVAHASLDTERHQLLPKLLNETAKPLAPGDAPPQQRDQQHDTDTQKNNKTTRNSRIQWLWK